MRARLFTIGLILAASTAVAAVAVAKPPQLHEEPAEKEQLLACEKRLCRIVVDRPASGEDLRCTLTKTWPHDQVKAGAEAASRMSWSMGGARCTVPFMLPRQALVSALVDQNQTLQFPEHTVTCDVAIEEKLEKVYVTLSPKIVFQKGEAQKIWVNVKKVDGPTSIKTMVWAAATIEDKLGLFHKTMLKEVNKFLHQRCPERVNERGKG